MKFGERLIQLRQAAKKTQDALASEAGLSQGSISKLEHGNLEPTPEVIRRLAHALGVSPRGLVGGTEVADMVSGDIVTVMTAVESGVRYLAYFASALTGLSDSDRAGVFHDAQIVRAVCEDVGAFLYEPKDYTDPRRNPDVAARDVYGIDRTQVGQSTVVVLHARFPSFGAGQEIEIAAAAGIPLILLIPTGTTVSRMVLGSHAQLERVDYADDASLRDGFRMAFDQVVNGLTFRRPSPTPSVGDRLQKLRHEKRLSVPTLARAAGVSDHAIEHLERNTLEQNPSLILLSRIADVLETHVSYLADGTRPNPEDLDPVLRRSKETLWEYARDSNIAFVDAQHLWDNFFDDYRQQRRAVADARTEPLSADDWRDRHNHVSEQFVLDLDDD